ncbi:MAG: hypothetical protein BVN34_02580 [Proteobacteria bacterium ST_bin12]|nr:MAG: hypothetical protein BVN34_02580 [Proteobacteria bacterium ST_bin12]
MASMLSDSAKEALSGAQETVLYFFGIVIVFSPIGFLISNLISGKSILIKKLAYLLFVGVGFFIAIKVVFF